MHIEKWFYVAYYDSKGKRYATKLYKNIPDGLEENIKSQGYTNTKIEEYIIPRA